MKKPDYNFQAFQNNLGDYDIQQSLLGIVCIILHNYKLTISFHDKTDL